MRALPTILLAGVIALAVISYPPSTHAGGHGHGHGRGKRHAHGIKHTGKYWGNRAHWRPDLYFRLGWPDENSEFRYGTGVGEAFPFDDEPTLRPRTDTHAFAWEEPEVIARLCQQEAAGSPDDTVTRIARTVEPNEA